MDKLLAFSLAVSRPLAASRLQWGRVMASPQSSVTPTITWEAIVDERPRLGHALYTAQHIKRRSPGFCANRVWYGILKPIVSREVGWGNKPRCRGHTQLVSEILAGKEPEHTDECRAERERQAWLQTPAAYDVAYETIYDALPNCQHELGGCW